VAARAAALVGLIAVQARRAWLDGDRWHLQHGPIDIVIGADGDVDAIAAAHEAAWRRFQTVLLELVAELPALRKPVGPRGQPDGWRGSCPLQGVIARRMWHACRPFHNMFITPMAAVAGAVAQELIACYEREGIDRAWVNNGGDIALHLAKNASARVGLFADLARFDATNVRADGHFEVHAHIPVRGIATSGWRGRSFSLGIADSVTVLARTAACADAAATMIANAVDVVDDRIRRSPASKLKDDSDLGQISITVDVPRLEAAVIQRALQAGQQRARELQREGLIFSAVLVCQDAWRRIEARAPQPELGSVFASREQT
jgi:ApbE superfamily uncharacterized protein (UPF0280 family)